MTGEQIVIQKEQRINMSCGQTPLSPACLTAIGEQLVEPVYYTHYPEVEKETCLMLKELMNTKNGPMLIPGSAVYGLEAAMLGTVESGDRVLTVRTGVFGRLLTELARFAGGDTTEIALEEGQSVDPETIRGHLLSDPEIKQVALVHCETTTGTLNPIEAIGRMLKDEFPDVIYMVDCVSSFGGVEVHVDDWGIDLLVTTTQKCLNAPQGLAIVVASEKAWDKIENLRNAPRAMCLDLHSWRRYGMEGGAAMGYDTLEKGAVPRARKPHPRDWPVHGPHASYTLVVGLHASLNAIMDEGPERVYRRQYVASRAVHAALRAMGLGILAETEASAAPVATRIALPDHLDAAELNRILFEEHGIALSSLARIGTMGFMAVPEHVLRTVSALEQTLDKMGWEVEEGAGVSAAREVFERSDVFSGQAGSQDAAL
ncbi:MAG: alanine--glyoxylate aminotransferase family protein [Gemmatimonadetes bacterium]|nr:alanine--glyoxylate aminotransferase family protein [Gemmatimonadota bacterium]